MSSHSVWKDGPYKTQFMYVVWRFLFFVLYTIVWRLKIEGREHVPDGPLILAVNHRSYADPPLSGVALPRPVHFFAKKELFKFSFIGRILRQMNAHPIDRKSSLSGMKNAQQILSENRALGIFPEGTRSKTDSFGPAKPGLGMLAFRAQAAVVPGYLHNSGVWYLFRQFRVKFGPPLYPKDFPDYQSLVSAVMARIANLREEILSEKK